MNMYTLDYYQKTKVIIVSESMQRNHLNKVKLNGGGLGSITVNNGKEGQQMSKKARNWLIAIIVAVIIVPIAGVSLWAYGDSHTKVESHSEQP